MHCHFCSGVFSSAVLSATVNRFRRVCGALVAVLVLGALIANPAAESAPGPQSCGLYTTSQGDFALVVQSGNVTCQEARGVFDRMFAGQATSITRNGSMIDAYKCVGNPAGIYSETGVLSYCEGNGARFELRNP